jgi:uncharacterized protein YciI
VTSLFGRLGLFVALSATSLASAAENANYFLLTYIPGASWNESISYEQQPGLKKHHEYLKELHINDLVVMGGTVPDLSQDFLSVMLLRTGTLEEAQSVAAQDPGVQMRLIRARVVPWNVKMSSMRFVHRRPQPSIRDPDQSFSIKRIDIESRLNIED